jgi:hypothetical protein
VRSECVCSLCELDRSNRGNAAETRHKSDTCLIDTCQDRSLKLQDLCQIKNLCSCRVTAAFPTIRMSLRMKSSHLTSRYAYLYLTIGSSVQVPSNTNFFNFFSRSVTKRSRKFYFSFLYYICMKYCRL